MQWYQPCTYDTLLSSIAKDVESTQESSISHETLDTYLHTLLRRCDDPQYDACTDILHHERLPLRPKFAIGFPPHPFRSSTLVALAQRIRAMGLTRERTYRLRTISNALIGKELIDFFLFTRQVSNREQAISLGQRLVQAGLLGLVGGARDSETSQFFDNDRMYQLLLPSIMNADDALVNSSEPRKRGGSWGSKLMGSASSPRNSNSIAVTKSRAAAALASLPDWLPDTVNESSSPEKSPGAHESRSSTISIRRPDSSIRSHRKLTRSKSDVTVVRDTHIRQLDTSSSSKSNALRGDATAGNTVGLADANYGQRSRPDRLAETSKSWRSASFSLAETGSESESETNSNTTNKVSDRQVRGSFAKYVTGNHKPSARQSRAHHNRSNGEDLDTELLRLQIEGRQLENRAVKAGFLTKRGHRFRNWKRRWFVLHGHTLLYYTKPGDETKCKGSIDLLAYLLEKHPIHNKEHGMHFIPKNVNEPEMLVYADSELEAAQWFQAVRQTVKEFDDWERRLSSLQAAKSKIANSSTRPPSPHGTAGSMRSRNETMSFHEEIDQSTGGLG